MYIIKKVIEYFYPDPALVAAKKDYEDYFKSRQFKEYKEFMEAQENQAAFLNESPINAPTSVCYLKLIHESMRSLEEIDLNDKILTAIEMHNRLLEEVIKYKDGQPQIADIEMQNFRKPGRTPGSKCLCH